MHEEIIRYKSATRSELSNDWRELLERAENAMSQAYSVYSKFSVGAALLLDNGAIETGNNQENAAYPSGLCAERVAFFATKAKNPDAIITKVAIIASSTEFDLSNPVSPCGGCRQVMAEYEQIQEKDIELLLAYPGEEVYLIENVSQLLPLLFNPAELRK
jgi:cytidine deaminase